MRKINIYLILLILVAISGCTFAPNYERVKMDMPTKFAGGDNYTVPSEWWKGFNDPVIDTLVKEALENNKDLAIAVARLEQSKASYGVAWANQFPSLDLNLRAGESYRNLKRTDDSNPSGITLGLNWEIDIFGKYRSASRSAKATLFASKAGYDAVKLSLIGQVVNNYFLIKSLNLQKDIARQTVETRKQTVDVYQKKFDQGLIGNIDLMQMVASLETARTVFYQTSMALDNANSAMMVLLGRSPLSIMGDNVTEGLSLEAIVGKVVIPSGIPSELLDRRPDIIQAEQMLIANNENIGTARAAWFPTISLTGLLGIVSPQLASLFGNGMTSMGYGATAAQNIVNFGKTSSNVDLAIAMKSESMQNYQKVVQIAFREIRDALTGQVENKRIIESLTIVRDKTKETNRFMRIRYDSGYSSILELLDNERQLLQAEIDLAKARNNYLTSIVNVYLALGGAPQKEVDSKDKKVEKTVSSDNVTSSDNATNLDNATMK